MKLEEEEKVMGRLADWPIGCALQWLIIHSSTLPGFLFQPLTREASECPQSLGSGASGEPPLHVDYRYAVAS